VVQTNMPFGGQWNRTKMCRWSWIFHWIWL